MTCIFVPFLKEVIGNLVSKAKGLNGLFVSQRFGLVAKEETFKIAVTIHIYRIWDYSDKGLNLVSIMPYVFFGR